MTMPGPYAGRVEGLSDVARERTRQDEKWGEQNHPDIPIGRTPDMACNTYAFDALEIPSEERAKFLCETGPTNWAAILVEELAEAVAAAERGNATELRAELVQVAAVAVAWVECVDRRSRRTGPQDGHVFPAAPDDETNPAYYVEHGVACVQVARHMSFNLGNALKYLWRAGKKGPVVVDLRKAMWYIADEIMRLGG